MVWIFNTSSMPNLRHARMNDLFNTDNGHDGNHNGSQVTRIFQSKQRIDAAC